MNVYDFDETIYNGDSSVDFYFYILNKNPKFLKYIFKQFKMLVLYKLKKVKLEDAKEAFFCFIKEIDVEKEVEQFWTKKEKHIKKWYLKKQKSDDLIISASPEFLLKPICERLKIKNLICSKINIKTGKFEGKNCKGQEKVNRFNQEYKDEKIEEFYSDSYTDQALADISKKAYIVDGEELNNWEKRNNKKEKKSLNLVSKIIFIISCMIFNWVIINAVRYEYLNDIRWKCLFISTIMAIVYTILVDDIFATFNKSSKKVKVISLLASFGAIVFYILRMDTNENYSIILFEGYEIISYFIIGLLMIPFLLVMFSKVYKLLENVFTKLYKESTKTEKIVVLVTFLILFIIVFICFIRTNNIWKLPRRVENVYSFDTHYLFYENAWLNVFHGENDIRQPLFTVFCAPFVAPAYGFVGFFEQSHEMLFPIVIATMNISLVIIISYMLSTLVEKGKRRIIFFIFYISTFAPLLFCVMQEQYVVSVFWIMTLIYMCIKKIRDRKLAFIGATGTLLTNGILFPMLYNKKDRFLKKIKRLTEAFFYSSFVFFIFSRMDMIYEFELRFNNLMYFTGKKLTFLDKFIQYSHFIPNCFLNINSVGIEDAWKTVKLTQINIFGIIMISMILLGFIISRKDKFSKICFGWSIFSFLILSVLGWGTQENGLILYSLYFGWAFVVLIYKLLKFAFIKIKCGKAFDIVIVSFSVLMLIYNIYNINCMITYLSQFQS